MYIHYVRTYVCGPFRKDPYDNFVCTYSIMQTQPTIVGVKSLSMDFIMRSIYYAHKHYTYVFWFI